jgi:hypothetical protein
MIRTSIEGFQINPPPPIDDIPKRPSVMQEVEDLLKDPKAPLADVVRLITIEIAHLVAAMRTCSERRAPFSQVKSNMSQIRALQLISRTVVKNYARSGLDELNMDGPKFQFVFSEIVDCFTDALKNATKKPKEDYFNQIIMKEFRDLIAVREPDIRRKVAKIDS